MSCYTQPNVIRLYIGETRSLRAYIIDDAGDPLDLDGSTVFSSLREAISGTRLWTKSSNDDIVILDSPGGVVDVQVFPADIAALSGRYIYDIWIEFFTGDRMVAVPPTSLYVSIPVTMTF